MSQELDATPIAFFGAPGSHTHAAAFHAFPTATLVPAPTIRAVFDAIGAGTAGRGVVPLENSTEGSIGETLDQLLGSQLCIQRELAHDIEQCLIGHGPIARIERVASHPQALAQTRDWLARELPNATVAPAASTSAAVEAARADPRMAAVSGRFAAELYGVPVLVAGIQDLKPNVTRFAVVGRERTAPSGSDRTTLVFTTRHERGALRRVLEVFDTEGLNLSRIESRPSRTRLWEYLFFVDVEGHAEETPTARALERLAPLTGELRVLGSYPIGTAALSGGKGAAERS